MRASSTNMDEGKQRKSCGIVDSLPLSRTRLIIQTTLKRIILP